MGPPAGSRTGGEAPLRPWQRVVALARFALAVGLVLTGVATWLRSGLAVPPVTYVAGPVPVLIAFVSTATYASIGLAITLRRPEVRTGRILAWVAVVEGIRDIAWGYLALAEASTSPLPIDPAILAWLNYALTIPIVATLLITLAAIFPADRVTRRTGWRVPMLAGAAGALVVVGGALRAGPIAFVPTYSNPLASSDLTPVAAGLQVAGYALLGATGVMAAVSLAARYRQADPLTRAQLRVFTGATVFLAAGFALLLVTSLANLGSLAARDLIAVAFLVGTALIPIAVAVAVGRYRLYEIDRLVSRGFVYGMLTAILAGLYTASIQLFTLLFKLLTGESSDVVLVITTLILASTFTPIKKRLEEVAARVTVDPSQKSGFASAATPAGFGDPTFLAALDARIRAVTAAPEVASGEARKRQ